MEQGSSKRRIKAVEVGAVGTVCEAKIEVWIRMARERPDASGIERQISRWRFRECVGRPMPQQSQPYSQGHGEGNDTERSS
jgi:phage gp16-like protein